MLGGLQALIVPQPPTHSPKGLLAGHLSIAQDSSTQAAVRSPSSLTLIIPQARLSATPLVALRTHSLVRGPGCVITPPAPGPPANTSELDAQQSCRESKAVRPQLHGSPATERAPRSQLALQLLGGFLVLLVAAAWLHYAGEHLLSASACACEQASCMTQMSVITVWNWGAACYVACYACPSAWMWQLSGFSEH